jgi:hypothetical protein
MKHVGKTTVLSALFFAHGFASIAFAEARILTIENASGVTITAVTIIDKEHPEQIVLAPLSSPIAYEMTVDLSITPAADTCLHDITYTYSSGKTVQQENVDICGVDVLIAE